MLKDYAFGLDTHVSHLGYWQDRKEGEEEEVARNVCVGCRRNFRYGMEDLSGEQHGTAAEETAKEITEQHGTGRKRERDREIPSKLEKD